MTHVTDVGKKCVNMKRRNKLELNVFIHSLFTLHCIGYYLLYMKQRKGGVLENILMQFHCHYMVF